MDISKPATAFVGTAYVGTERVGRALTPRENRQLSEVLRANDFVGASVVALGFALKLRRGNRAAAEDLRDRVYLRLVRLGWDRGEIALVKCLCRFVWSEHTNEAREGATTRKAEERYLREQGVLTGEATPSVEDVAVDVQQDREDDERNDAKYKALRAALVEANDEVNLLWLDYSLEGITDLGEMARRSNRDPKDFYNAKARRNRVVARLAAEKKP